MRCGTVASRESLHAAVGDLKNVGAMADCGLELAAAGPAAAKPPLDFDDWDFDPDLRALRKPAAVTRSAANALPTSGIRFDAPPTMPMWPSEMPQQSTPSTRAVQRTESGHRTSGIAWTIMSLGLMAFTCGGVLLGWSHLAGRNDLWSMGVPLAVLGQIGLLVGLVFQLERMWQNNRYAVSKLEEVDERLHDIKHSQNLMRVNHSSAAQAFYTHLAEGANPSMLLADLKGQLDLLAMRMSERR